MVFPLIENSILGKCLCYCVVIDLFSYFDLVMLITISFWPGNVGYK